MRKKSIKLMFPISVMLTLALLFGSASHVFAAPPAHAEKVDVLVSFTGKPGNAEQSGLLCRPHLEKEMSVATD